jgi:phosphoribosylformylglycinamidine synthase subunit PurS
MHGTLLGEVPALKFPVEVKVRLKPGVLDAEGKNVQKSLELLAIPVEGVKAVKTYWITFERASEAEALEAAEEACRRLLANPVVHDYTIRLLPEAERATGAAS